FELLLFSCLYGSLSTIDDLGLSADACSQEVAGLIGGQILLLLCHQRKACCLCDFIRSFCSSFWFVFGAYRSSGGNQKDTYEAKTKSITICHLAAYGFAGSA